MSDWLLIFFMFCLTFLPRYIPLALAGKVKIPHIIESSLKFVPIAVLSSIITQASLIREGEILINYSNHYFYAAIISILVSRITNQLYVIVSIGMMVFYILKLFS